MQISGSSYQFVTPQPRLANTPNFLGSSTSTASSTSQSSDQPVEAFAPQELKNGFFGASRSTIDAALAAGKIVDTLSFLTPSDIDLVQKTTGITIKDGSYFNSSGQEFWLQSDSDGSPSGPDAGQMQAAFDLANSLSQMRQTGGPGNSTNLVSGGTVTADDLKKYLDAYAKAEAEGRDVLRPDTAVIDAAEAILKSENATS